MSNLLRSGTRELERLPFLKYYNALKQESRFTLGLNAAKNTHYICSMRASNTVLHPSRHVVSKPIKAMRLLAPLIRIYSRCKILVQQLHPWLMDLLFLVSLNSLHQFEFLSRGGSRYSHPFQSICQHRDYRAVSCVCFLH